MNDRILALESEIASLKHSHDQELKNRAERLDELNSDYRKLTSTVAEKNHVSLRSITEYR